MPLDLHKLGQLLQHVGHLLENPDEYERFKQRFAGAAKHTALRIAREGGAPPVVIERLKRDLGLGPND